MSTVRSFFRSSFGISILKNLPLLLATFTTLFFGFSGRGQTTDVYSTVGTYTWVVPACVTSVTVRAWGGGGAYCIKTEVVTPGETLRITVGSGGAGGSGNNGVNGGYSQVEHLAGSVVFCRAAGGSRGMKSTCNSGCFGTGGAGGSISNNIPVNTGFNGGAGGSSDPVVSSTDRGGGGGGGAGTGSAGGIGGIVTAGLAGSPGGGSGGSGASTTTAAAGQPGNFPGGGGGGGATWNSSANGGAGARGQVTITYVTTGCQPAQTTFSYTTPGTYNWVVPACVNYVSVEVWGGGGGGGGNIAVLTTSGGETCTGAGGGGGGGYAARTYAVTPGQSYTIVVGAGGAAGPVGVGTTAGITTAAGTGGNGQSSTFSGPATVGSGTLSGGGGFGGGGAGGRNTSSSACLAVNGSSGAGGVGANGTLNYSGGIGAAGLILDHSTDKSGGGGGSAGPGGNGGNAPSAGSVGVATPLAGVGNPSGGNGGAGRMWNTPALSQMNGIAGSPIGGGGGGSLIHTSSIGVYTAVGGEGGRGEVRLTYNTGCPLPIELVYFNGTCQEGVKTFNWATASEHNNQFFTIEHSQDGSDFYPVQVIEGAENSTVLINYNTTLIDNEPKFVYYRLKQTDLDGAFTYTNLVHVDCIESQPIFVNPNPFEGQLTIELGNVGENDLEILVIDVNGRVVFKGIKEKFMKSQQMTLDLSHLSGGVYFLEIRNPITNSTIHKTKVTKL